VVDDWDKSTSIDGNAPACRSTVSLEIMAPSGLKVDSRFTPEQVAKLLGKRLLVGLTHRSADDKVVSLEKFHGTIDRVSLTEGLVLKLHGTAKERFLPPDITRLEPAEPGEYRLKTTGEVVVDPDFTLMWTIYPKGYKGDDL